MEFLTITAAVLVGMLLYRAVTSIIMGTLMYHESKKYHKQIGILKETMKKAQVEDVTKDTRGYA